MWGTWDQVCTEAQNGIAASLSPPLFPPFGLSPSPFRRAPRRGTRSRIAPHPRPASPRPAHPTPPVSLSIQVCTEARNIIAASLPPELVGRADKMAADE